MTSEVKSRPSKPEALHSPFEDLAEMLQSTWDDQRVLQNVRLRFMCGMPYTSLLGNIIIAVNPCKNLVELYDRDMQVFPLELPRRLFIPHGVDTQLERLFRGSEK